MTELYTTKYLDKIKLKKRNLLISYFVALGVVIAIITAIMIIYANEPYGTNLRIPFIIALVAICVFFIVYSFIFFNISYGRIKNYYNFVYHALFSKQEIEKVTVIANYNQVREVLGVEFYSLTVLCWSNIENDYVERNLYVDCELNIENFSKNDVLTVRLNSNYLVAYKKENL